MKQWYKRDYSYSTVIDKRSTYYTLLTVDYSWSVGYGVASLDQIAIYRAIERQEISDVPRKIFKDLFDAVFERNFIENNEKKLRGLR